MDLLRRLGWLRVLTVLLVGLGSTAVAAQPRGPSGESGTGEGTASESGVSPLVTANAVGLVDGTVLVPDLGAAWASPSPGESVLVPPPVGGSAQARTAPGAERPLRHRLCVYRL